MRLPNLVGCGAGKSGTTSLYHYLDQHPSICMAQEKEIHYFSKHYEKGKDWYLAKFESCDNLPIIGEFSTSYMLDSAVPKRLAHLLPEARLMFAFRDPIERAYSNYWFSVSIGTQDEHESFSKAIRNPYGFDKFVASGFYDVYLQRFLQYYGQGNIHVVITEDLKKDPQTEIAKCYRFLGIDPRFVPDLQRSYNVTVAAGSAWKVRLIRTWINAKKQVKPALRWLPVYARRDLSFLERQLAKKLIGDEKPPMEASDRAYLNHVYRDHNERLAHLLGRDLGDWQ